MKIRRGGIRQVFPRSRYTWSIRFTGIGKGNFPMQRSRYRLNITTTITSRGGKEKYCYWRRGKGEFSKENKSNNWGELARTRYSNRRRIRYHVTLVVVAPEPQRIACFLLGGWSSLMDGKICLPPPSFQRILLYFVSLFASTPLSKLFDFSQQPNVSSFKLIAHRSNRKSNFFLDLCYASSKLGSFSTFVCRTSSSARLAQTVCLSSIRK